MGKGFSTKRISRQTYLKFIEKVLRVTFNSKGNLNAIYPLLQVNLDKLDNNFAQLLQSWAKTALSRASFREAQDIAASLGEFSNLIAKFPLGSKAINLEIAIAGYETALKVFTRDSFPARWATTQCNLGATYCERILGDRTQNIEDAITACELALQVQSPEALPQDWALTQNTLGVVYRERIVGNRVENIECAINACKAALQVYTEESFPEQWAMAQSNLGTAYCQRIKGDQLENIEKAIVAYKFALQFYTKEKEAFLQDWVGVYNNLGTAYQERIFGDQEQNIEDSLRAYQTALQSCSQKTLPEKWAEIQNNLGNSFLQRLQGNREKNLEDAINAYQAALQVRTQQAFRYDWAMTQSNLGVAYSERIHGEREQNLNKAIAAFKSAQKVWTRDEFPQDWATVQLNLGNTYRQTGQITEAIECFRLALQIYKPTTFPTEAFKAGQSLGDTAFTVGLWAEAIEGYRVAIDAVEQSRVWVFTDIRRLALLDSAIKVYMNMVQASINNGQFEQAIEYVERSKTRHLVELLATRDLYPKGDVPETILSELKQLRQEIATEQRCLINAERSAWNAGINSNRDYHQQDIASISISHRHRLNQLQQQLSDLIDREIQPIDPSFSLTQKLNPISFQEIQALLPNSQTAIIEWYITDEKFFTFIITPQTQTPIIWQSLPEDFKALMDWAAKYITDYHGKNSEWKFELVSYLSELTRILHLNHILSLVPKTCTQLILIPHRFLHLSPLHSLPLEDGSCLLDSFPHGVRYVPSCQLLQLIQKQQRPDFSHFLGIQNPTQDLTHANLEVQAIAYHFNPAYVLAQEEGTKTAISTSSYVELLRSAHCLHFSCHGSFNIVLPLQSNLELADGSLTLEEIFNLNLNQCRLVTLSACETGLIDFSGLVDEYEGLPSGFLYAGSASVVSSLWKVNDLSTALLMIKFYQNLLSSSSVAIALNTAQTWLRDATTSELRAWASHLKLSSELTQQIEQNLDWFDSDEKPFQEPYHWAAFCAVGQ